MRSIKFSSWVGEKSIIWKIWNFHPGLDFQLTWIIPDIYVYHCFCLED